MSGTHLPVPTKQGPATDKFFYFFMGLRKGEIRRRVATLKSRHPDESPTKLARRLMVAQLPLSQLGSALIHLPQLVPHVGPALKILGVAGGATVLMRMHMSLILEIALLFDRDIDDPARLKEMAVVIASTGLASSTSLLTQAFDVKPYHALLAGEVTVTAVSQLIGEAAIHYYGGTPEPTTEDAAPAQTSHQTTS